MYRRLRLPDYVMLFPITLWLAVNDGFYLEELSALSEMRPTYSVILLRLDTLANTQKGWQKYSENKMKKPFRSVLLMGLSIGSYWCL